VPHTVGTHAGSTCRQWGRWSTCCLRLRPRQHGAGAFVPVRGLPGAGADLQLLRPRTTLLRGGLRPAGPTPHPAVRRTALSGWPEGRRRHAARQGRYRARRKNVTHHGSLPPPSDDLLPPSSLATASNAAVTQDRARRLASHCHWCGRRCPDFVRQFLRGRWRRGNRLQRERRESNHGDAARDRGSDSPSASRGEVDDRHHRGSGACPSQRGSARAGSGRPAADRGGAASVADRGLSALHPSDAGELPDPDGEPPLRHGL
jgi:hypothetical protein